MNTIALPQPVADFVKAENEHDSETLTACFTPDAVVYDDGAEMRGSQAIKEWAEEVSKAYNLTMEPTGLTESEDETVLTALVSGNFEGSPLEFQYTFNIKDGSITSLSCQVK